MIDDLLLRLVVIGLLVLGAATYGLATVSQRRAWTSVVSYGLYLVMAIAMAVMAWPSGAQLPRAGAAMFFLLATVWFLTITIVSARTVPQRAECGYHALMMLSMAWMYAVMESHPLPGRSDTAHHMLPGDSMPGMGMSATGMPGSVGSPGLITAVNWFWFVVFVVAAVAWTYPFVAERSHGAAHPWWSSLGGAGQAMMAAGMATMFGAILFRH
jgi:hypothetical protein